MATRKGNGKNGTRDLLARRMLKLEREVGATNAGLDVTNIRLGRLEQLTEQLVELTGNGFRDLREEMRGMREDIRTLVAAVRELGVDHARVDRLEARVDRLERTA